MTKEQRNKRTKKQKGTTIMELLVTMALFLTFIDIATAVFIRSLRTQRIAVSQMATNSNAALAIEQIVRELRIGKDFCKDQGDCIPSQPLSGDPISRLTFTKEEDKITYDTESPPGLNIKSIRRTVNNGFPSYLTADNVDVKKLTFRVTGISSGDKFDPKITVTLQIGTPSGSSINNLQTSVSVRIPSVDP
ncbi:MAG: hypothetical protein HZB99_04865 [Candidatus Harrisonbacteria bacterium]|nr:hypothetical protein [Candidatus Harrisonbacteria bacterium]